MSDPFESGKSLTLGFDYKINRKNNTKLFENWNSDQKDKYLEFKIQFQRYRENKI